ncbi:MAG TPA: sulfotransferase, partial [Steroidobacteraceae bacterium]|nr:sulfotransferase [Steroidobacteraceae bacterium]
RELQELRTQLLAVPADRLLELRFEDLLDDPLVELERAVRFLGLEFTPQYRAAIASLQLRPVRPRWGEEWDDRQLESVLREAQPLLRQLGYTK